MEEQVHRPSPERDEERKPPRRVPLLPPRPARSELASGEAPPREDGSPARAAPDAAGELPPAAPAAETSPSRVDARLEQSLFPSEEDPGAPPHLEEGLVARASALEALFEELAHLGTGGTGVVVLARDRRSGEQVALKRLRRAEDGQRFLREARLIAALEHPAIVRLRQVITTDDEQVALVLEHVPGPDLETLVEREGAVDPLRALRMARRLAEALAYAHSRGVVHRDVKPGNVLLLADGSPKLTDFGLALAAPTHSLLLSQAAGMCGTLDYMAPEQRGEADRVDGRADVYGLGATLYRVLTGSSPRVIREGRIPEPAREVVLRCVEEDPRERYPSMEVLIAALDRAATRARSDESDSRPPLERIADAFQRRLEQAERAEHSRRLSVAAGGLAALGLLGPDEPGRSRTRLDMGEPWESELGRLVASVLEAAQARGREAASLLADAHALLTAALAGVPIGERGRAALRLLDRRSRSSGRMSLAGRLGAVLRRLIEHGTLPPEVLGALREGEPDPQALLERVLRLLRERAVASGPGEWSLAETRWRRALEALATALPEPALAERMRREGMALELERLAREQPPEQPPGDYGPSSRVG